MKCKAWMISGKGSDGRKTECYISDKAATAEESLQIWNDRPKSAKPSRFIPNPESIHRCNSRIVLSYSEDWASFDYRCEEYQHSCDVKFGLDLNEIIEGEQTRIDNEV